MPQFHIESESHHNAEHNEFAEVIEAKNKSEAIVAGLQRLFEHVFGDEWEPPSEQFLRAFLKKAKGRKSTEVFYSAKYGYDSVDDDLNLAIWFDHSDGGGENIGMGATSEKKDSKRPSEGTDKYENRWIHVQKWTPKPARVKAVKKMSKKELQQQLLRAEASR